MIRTYRIFSVLFLFGSALLFSVPHVIAAEGDAQWARSVGPGAPDESFSNGVTVDSNNNVYTVQGIRGTGTYDFGNSVTVNGGYSFNNAAIAKYDANGLTQWAKSTGAGGPNSSIFNGIGAGTDNNVYAVGYITGSGSYNFGNSVTVSGGYAFNSNTLIVKYNSSGLAQWAASTGAGAPGVSVFSGVAVGSDNSVYAIGYIRGPGLFSFGNGVTVTAANSSPNAVIVKYNSSGLAQWATSTGAGAPSSSVFQGVAVGSDNNVYAVGYISGNGSYDFGNGVTISGGNSGGSNILVVKYSSNGQAIWAKSDDSGGPDTSLYYNVAVGTDNSVYVSGAIHGNGTFNFGNGITASGGNSTSNNATVVKYDSSGLAQWATSTGAGAPDFSIFVGITIGLDGSIIAAGSMNGTSAYDFGNNVTISGGNTSSNTLLVKFNSNGQAQWARSTGAGAPNYSSLSVAAASPDSGIYVVGQIYGTSPYGFGNGVTLSCGNANANILIVKYQGPAAPIQVVTTNTSTASTVSPGSPGPAVPQIPDLNDPAGGGGIFESVVESSGFRERVNIILQPGIFNFNGFLFSKNVSPGKNGELPNPVTGNFTGIIPKNTVVAGTTDNGNKLFLGLKTGSGIAWQVNSIKMVWLKAYAPGINTVGAAIIIPDLQKAPSIIILHYQEEDLIPPGQRRVSFDPKKLRIAQSFDGINWKIQTNSVVDTKNNSVAIIGKIGGYYMIVSGGFTKSSKN